MMLKTEIACDTNYFCEFKTLMKVIYFEDILWPNTSQMNTIP